MAQVARGVDLARVNLVANLDLPRDSATYMHRVGRTGRYGTRGIAVTFLTPQELARLRDDLQDIAGVQARDGQLPLGWGGSGHQGCGSAIGRENGGKGKGRP